MRAPSPSKLAELREAIGRIPALATKRGAMSKARKLRIHKDHNGLCVQCETPVEPLGPTVIYDHELPLELGGSDDDTNIGPVHASPCNKVKTAADASRIAKMRRQAKMDEPREPSQIQSRPFPKDNRPKGQRGFQRRTQG